MSEDNTDCVHQFIHDLTTAYEELVKEGVIDGYEPEDFDNEFTRELKSLEDSAYREQEIQAELEYWQNY